jgi:hypothetical protein
MKIAVLSFDGLNGFLLNIKNIDDRRYLTLSE